jgi:hypothetical protein
LDVLYWNDMMTEDTPGKRVGIIRESIDSGVGVSKETSPFLS